MKIKKALAEAKNKYLFMKVNGGAFDVFRETNKIERWNGSKWVEADVIDDKGNDWIVTKHRINNADIIEYRDNC